MQFHLLLVIAVVCVVLATPTPPTWPTKYYIELDFELPYTALLHRMTVQKSTTAMKVSFFDDLDYTIYKFPNGIENDINGRYIYTRGAEQKQECSDVTASLEPGEDVELPVYLPNLSKDWVYESTETIEGIETYKYTLDNTSGDKPNRYYFYVTPNGIPVRWTQLARSLPFGSHTDNYYINYRVFKPNWNEAKFDNYPSICDNVENASKTSGSTLLRFHTMVLPHEKRSSEEIDYEFHPLFEEWAASHNKQYSSVQEKIRRESIFLNRHQWLTETNEKAEGRFGVAHNHYSDRSISEIMKVFGGKKHNPELVADLRASSEDIHSRIGDDEVPETVDWRVDGYVDHVRDQAACGSCWTFSVMGLLETRVAIAQKEFIPFSEQSIVDCYWTDATENSESSHGCEGGDENAAAKWLMDNKKGVAFLSEYPYLGLDSYCREDAWHTDSKYTIKAVHIVDEGDNNGLKKALQSGPVAVAISVDEPLIFYSFGIIDSPDSAAMDIVHAIVCVGYSKAMDGTEYWILRNSWSTHWGNNGYFYAKISDENQYRVSSDAMYVEMNE